MENKKFSTVKLLVFIFCLLLGAGSSTLFAQSAKAAAGAKTTQNFQQKLQWNSDPNVLEYKIEVQDSTGKIINSITTDKNSVELSLQQGSYRYKITAYDLLGREAVSTKWTPFEILTANSPAIEHNQALESLADDGKSLELNVNIADVTADSVAQLVNVETGKKITGSLVLATSAAALAGSEVQTATKATFANVPEGKWKLVITNPSGLSSETESFEVKDTIKERKIAAAKAEEERKKQEAEFKKQEAERLKREEAERKEAERIAAEKAAKEEAERLAREEEERKIAEKLAAEKAAREEEERRAIEEQQRILEEVKRVEQERKAAELAAREEKIQKIMEEERIEKERVEREKQAKIDAENAAIEAERFAREEEERLAREEEERLAREEAEAEEKENEKQKRREAWLNYDRKFYIIAGAGLAMPLYDNGFFEDIIDKTLWNPGLTAQIGILPFHTNWMRFGMEINGIATQFKNENDLFKLNLNMLLLQDNLALRFAVGKQRKAWIQIKGGGGISIIQEILDYSQNSTNNKQNKTLNFGYFTAGGGLSVLFIPSAMFMVELGADFYNVFIPDMNMGVLTPYLGIGLRF